MARCNLLKLQKVELLGFKSFADRTEIAFSGNGIAAVVGPNGCGKSNISDTQTATFAYDGLNVVWQHRTWGTAPDPAYPWAAILYGVALALTFDEFGMWLHLDTDYWQRVSFDAVVVVGALLGLVATSPALRQFRPRHWATAIALIATLALFGIVLLDSYRYAGRKLGPYLEQVRPPRQP